MMLFPTPISPIPIQALGDVSAFMVEITAAHVSGGTAYHTFFVIASAGCKVYWGDGAVSTLSSGTNTCTHTYAGTGRYLIQVKGPHTVFYHGSGSTAAKVVEGIKLYSGMTNCDTTFSGCNNDLFTLYPYFRFPPNATSFYNTFYGCGGKKFALPDGIAFPATTQYCTGTFWNCFGESFVTLPDSLVLVPAMRILYGAFYHCLNLRKDITNFFPDFTGSTVNVSFIFNSCPVSGTAPAGKLWERSDITWTSSGAFTGCLELTNYAAIPAGWK